MKITVGNQQSVFDVALITLGDIAATVYIMYHNIELFPLGINTILEVGTVLNVPDKIVDGTVVAALGNLTELPATEVDQMPDGIDIDLDGIGYMIIEGGPPQFRVFE